MSTHKHIDRICIVAVVAALLICIVFMNGEALGIQAAERVMGYESRLFDTSQVHTIDIVMDDWEGFIDTAESEEYSVCTVVIDGEKYSNVGIRGKGNTSLSSVSSMDSDRYSFKIEFDQYDSTKSYYGLDKLSLNNIIQDATYMKDYLTYRLMGEFGVAAPLCSYVYITINGADWGLYLAVEGVEDAFLRRNYGTDYGELYKPDSLSMGGGRGNGMDFDMEQFRSDSVGDESRDGSTGENLSGGRQNGGGMGMGSSDVKLQYIDDDLDSYSNIFSSAKTDITQTDQIRLIQALKTLSGENAASAVDIDQVMRYFVVHNYVVNGDSYTGSMIHNYYLYEEDGVLSMIPWDYNLAFGTFQGSNANSAVNDPIDTPLSVTGSGDRPMIDWIFASEEYTRLYHQYFAQFLETVDITSIIDDAATLIAPYVEKDPTAFYSYKEFKAGVTTLRDFCTLRTQSVLGQLNGEIPSTDAGQSANDTALIDASGLNLTDMGSMNMGGMGGRDDNGGFGGFDRGEMGGRSFKTYMTERPAMTQPENMSRMEDIEMTPPSGQNGTMQPTEMGTMPTEAENPERTENMDTQIPEHTGGNFDGAPEGRTTTAQSGNTLGLLVVSAVVLILGLIIVFKYKRY